MGGGGLQGEGELWEGEEGGILSNNKFPPIGDNLALLSACVKTAERHWKSK